MKINDSEQTTSLATLAPMKKRDFDSVLDDVRLALGLSDSEWKEVASLTEKEWSAIQKKQASYSAHHMISFCRSLEINPDLLFGGGLDVGRVAAQRKSKVAIYPEIYLNPDTHFSRARSSQVVLRHLEMNFGAPLTKRILSRLQMPSVFLNTDPNSAICSQLNIDLLSEIKKEGLVDQDIVHMGTLNLAAIRGSSAGQVLQKSQYPKELYSYFVEVYLNQFEALTEGKVLHCSDSSCTISLKIKDSVKEAFKSQVVGVRESCLFRQGFAKCLLGLIRKDFSYCEELTCMYRGDKSCTYRLSWESSPTSTRKSAGDLKSLKSASTLYCSPLPAFGQTVASDPPEFHRELEQAHAE